MTPIDLLLAESVLVSVPDAAYRQWEKDMPDTLPKMQPGYAYQSSRLTPVEPETVMVSQDDCDTVKYIGVGRCEENECNVWKVPGMKRYYFQLKLGDT